MYTQMTLFAYDPAMCALRTHNTHLCTHAPIHKHAHTLYHYARTCTHTQAHTHSWRLNFTDRELVMQKAQGVRRGESREEGCNSDKNRGNGKGWGRGGGGGGGGRHLLLPYNPHVHLLSLAVMIHTLKACVEKW